jgi:outer membrane murein-binding lipoprotein Lpp
MAISNSARSAIKNLNIGGKKQSALGAYDASKADFDKLNANYVAETSNYQTMLNNYNNLLEQTRQLDIAYEANDSTKHPDRSNRMAKQIFANNQTLAAMLPQIDAYGQKVKGIGNTVKAAADRAKNANKQIASVYSIEERLDQSRSKKTKGVAGTVAPKTSLGGGVGTEQRKTLLGG